MTEKKQLWLTLIVSNWDHFSHSPVRNSQQVQQHEELSSATNLTSAIWLSAGPDKANIMNDGCESVWLKSQQSWSPWFKRTCHPQRRPSPELTGPVILFKLWSNKSKHVSLATAELRSGNVAICVTVCSCHKYKGGEKKVNYILLPWCILCCLFWTQWPITKCHACLSLKTEDKLMLHLNRFDGEAEL